MASWFDSMQREALAAIERTRSTIDRALDIEEPPQPVTVAPAPKQQPSSQPAQQPPGVVKSAAPTPAKPLDAPTPQKSHHEQPPSRQPAVVPAPQAIQQKQQQQQADVDPFFAALLPPGSSNLPATLPAHPTPKHPDTPAKPKTSTLDSASKPKAAKVCHHLIEHLQRII